jgi:competence protein ComEC
MCLLKERQNWLLWWPVGMGCGIALYVYQTTEPANFTVTIIFLGACFLWALTFLCTPHVRLFYATSLPFFLYGLCAVALGFAMAKFRCDRVHTPFLTTWLKGQLAVGTVEDVEKIKSAEKKGRFILRITEPTLGFQKARIFLSFKSQGAEMLAIGSKVRCKVTFWPIPAPTTLYGYDPQFVSYFSGIGAYGRVTQPCTVLEKEPVSWLSEKRTQLTDILRNRIHGSAGEIAAALITGDRSGIPDPVRQNFADAGIAHILAISGLHVSLLAGMVFLFLRRGLACVFYSAEGFSFKKWAAILCIPITGFYVALSGFGFPAMRAFIMTSIFMVAIMFDRNPLSLRSLAFAATGILLFFPESLFSVSFQLSFAAVIGLIAFYEHTSSRAISGVKLYVLGLVMTTIIATLATTPFIISTFNRFTLQAITGNLLAIPAVGFVIMPCLMLSLCSLIFGGWNFIFHLNEISLNSLIHYAQWVAGLPGAIIYLKTPHPMCLVIFTFGALWLCLWKKTWRLWGIPIIVASFFVAYFSNPLPTAITDREAKIMAYYKDNVLWVSNMSRGKFFQKQWSQVFGNVPIKEWTETVQTLQAGKENLKLDASAISKTQYIWQTKKGFILKTQGEILGTRPWRHNG